MQVVKAHDSSIEVSPVAKKGERVKFIAFDPKNAAWFRGRDARGVVGYFPGDWFRIDGGSGFGEALRDYDAKELTVSAGEAIEVIERYGQWRLVRSGKGVGRIPDECCPS